jgi:DNA-binding MarR family transcriptional regulator
MLNYYYMANRAQLIADITEGMGSIRRLAFIGHGHCPTKGTASHMPTRSQVGILRLIERDGAQNLKDLAKRLCMTPSAATQLVESLVEEKVLTRTEDKTDRRKILLALTSQGKLKLARARKIHQAALEKLLAPLTERELVAWKNIQGKIIQYQRERV